MQHSERFSYIQAENPALRSELLGNSQNPGVTGLALAYWLDGGLYIRAEFHGLPPDNVFGMHVHEGIICGDPGGSEPFIDAEGHLSLCPEDTWCGRHPFHTGDLPPVFSDSEGYAAMEVYIGKASVSDYSGKPLILHTMPDDFAAQHSGNSGKRLACGIFAEVL